MGLRLQRTTQGGVLGKHMFNLLTKKMQRKLCRSTRREWDTGGVGGVGGLPSASLALFIFFYNLFSSLVWAGGPSLSNFLFFKLSQVSFRSK